MGAAGAGGGGLTMAYQANNIGQGAAPPPPQAGNATGPSGGPIFLGMDVSDKNQSITLRQVKNVAHLPLVGIDLHATDPLVAYFPPKTEDPSVGGTPVLVGKMKSSLYFHATEASHKVLRKYLAQSKTFLTMQKESMSTAKDGKAVELSIPHEYLGLRRLADAPAFLQPPRGNDDENKKSHAIDQDVSQSVGALLVNSTLDGSSDPTGDDFDRVVWRIRLTEAKKAISVLPEEAVQMMLHQAQYHVATARKADKENEDIVDYPCAIALPSWAFHDAGVESLMEALPGVVVFPRSLCALAGGLLPPLDSSNIPRLLQRIMMVRKASHQEYKKLKVQDPGAQWEEDVTLVLIGVTERGMEATAVQISSENSSNACALFGQFKCISSVAYQGSDPLSLMEKCTKELESEVDRIAPDADGPAGIVFYGTSKEQESMANAWEKNKEALSEWTKVPTFGTKADAVALGASVLGAVSHGRSTRIRTVGNKSKPEMAIRIDAIAPVAVGVRLSYNAVPKDWSKVPVKVVFDFDRRIPAGPFTIDLNAAECAVHRSQSTDSMSEEQLLKAIKDNEGAKGIPTREAAALALRVQIVQKWTRDGDWKQVGDVMKPLVKSKEGKDKELVDDACEQVNLELSLGITGMITNSLVGQRCVSCFSFEVII